MNKVFCEVCGNSEIIKEGDSFVCQSCGTKYTLDAMRSMLGSAPQAPNGRSSYSTSYTSATRVTPAPKPAFDPAKVPGIKPKKKYIAKIVIAAIILCSLAGFLTYMLFIAPVFNYKLGVKIFIYAMIAVVAVICIVDIVVSANKIHEIMIYNRELINNYRKQNNY